MIYNKKKAILKSAENTYSLAPEANSFLRVKDGSLWQLLASSMYIYTSNPRMDPYLPNKGFDSPSTSVDLAECDFTNDLVSVVPIANSCQIKSICISRIFVPYFLSFLTFSISAGRLSANVSLRD